MLRSILPTPDDRLAPRSPPPQATEPPSGSTPRSGKTWHGGASFLCNGTSSHRPPNHTKLTEGSPSPISPLPSQVTRCTSTQWPQLAVPSALGQPSMAHHLDNGGIGGHLRCKGGSRHTFRWSLAIPSSLNPAGLVTAMECLQHVRSMKKWS